MVDDIGFATAARGAVAQHVRLHGLLCRMDNFCDHRDRNQGRARPERHPIRPAGRHADPHRVAGACLSRHLDRPIWRTTGFPADDAGLCGLDLPAFLCRYLCADAGCRAGAWACRWGLCGRCRLCLQMVPAGKAGHCAWLFRHGQCRCGGNEICRAVRDGGDGLDCSCAILGRSIGGDGGDFLPARKG
jgi:hypothetical protein